MRTSIVRIGNSRGLRIPKPLLEQCDINDEVELEVSEGGIVIRPVKTRPREGWDTAFKEMARKGDDSLLEMPESRWDSEEWEWK